ncbi:MAG: YkgJ family cysteine cluster protein [Candidatus Bathyarchaeales archaeon]
MEFTYPKKLRFKCIKCALCCGDTENRTRTILMLKTEVEKIATKTKMRPESFVEEVKGFEPYAYMMRKNANGKCIFLNKNRCTIYAYRPLICRFYPFELKGTSNGAYTFNYTEECPGIGKGNPLEKSFFEKLFKRFGKMMAKNTQV